MNIITIYTDSKGATLSTVNGAMPVKTGEKLYDTDTCREVTDVKPFFSQKKNLSGYRIVLSDPIPIDSPQAPNASLSLPEITKMLKEILEDEYQSICDMNNKEDSDTTTSVKQMHFQTELRCIKRAINQKFGISI